MQELPLYYQTPPYFRLLIKEFIVNHLKRPLENQLMIDHPIIYLKEQGYDVSENEEKLLKEWLENLLNFDYIAKTLVEVEPDNTIEEIMLHGHNWIQLVGKTRREFFSTYLNEEDYQFALETFSLRQSVLWNPSSPFRSFKVKIFNQSWRATLCHKSLSANGVSKLFLRAQAKQSFPINSFGVTPGQEELIEQCMRAKKNIIVCGATGSGKTTFLKALISTISQREHLITLEDTSELNPNSSFSTQLLSQNCDGHRLVDYCHYALRMRPDRLVLGEIRSAEVVPFLLSINTGHGGMMASLHANSALDSLERLCLLFQVYCGQLNMAHQEVMKLVCQGIDFIYYLSNKKVESIVEIKGCEGTTPYYELWN